MRGGLLDVAADYFWWEEGVTAVAVEVDCCGVVDCVDLEVGCYIAFLNVQDCALLMLSEVRR